MPAGRLSSPDVVGPRFPRLYAIVDVEYTVSLGRDPVGVASAFFENGVRLLQVRSKAFPGGALLEAARAIVERAEASGALVIVNDRPDIAVLAAAAGVHVGQDDLPPAAVRRVMPDGLLGLSTHTREQLDAALATAASYVAVGPVFGTSTKDTGHAAVGLELVRYAAARSDRPVVAIGGITLASAAEVIGAGATSVAIISDLLSGNPGERARLFTSALGD
jgi:thiamine-phosphate pyrophosphorylase